MTRWGPGCIPYLVDIIAVITIISLTSSFIIFCQWIMCHASKRKLYMAFARACLKMTFLIMAANLFNSKLSSSNSSSTTSTSSCKISSRRAAKILTQSLGASVMLSIRLRQEWWPQGNQLRIGAAPSQTSMNIMRHSAPRKRHPRLSSSLRTKISKPPRHLM